MGNKLFSRIKKTGEIILFSIGGLFGLFLTGAVVSDVAMPHESETATVLSVDNKYNCVNTDKGCFHFSDDLRDVFNETSTNKKYKLVTQKTFFGLATPNVLNASQVYP